MITLEVGKSYKCPNGTFTVRKYDPAPCGVLDYDCSDGMWRTQSGDAFPSDRFNDLLKIEYQVTEEVI